MGVDSHAIPFSSSTEPRGTQNATAVHWVGEARTAVVRQRLFGHSVLSKEFTVNRLNATSTQRYLTQLHMDSVDGEVGDLSDTDDSLDGTEEFD